MIAVIAYNDPFVMSAWGKANQIKGNDIVSVCLFEHPKVKATLGFLN